MLKIAVCDDNAAELRQIMSLIEEYPRKASYGIEAVVFSSSEELAGRLDEFDVFILDYRMPDIDGFELARRIREEYMTTKTIIFISQYDDIIYDAFEVHAHRYLMKPVEKEKLYRALNELDKDAYAFRRLFVRDSGDAKFIDIDSIYFIKADRKYAHIHYDNGGKEEVFVCKRSLDSLEKELSHFWFFRTHRSYLTNLTMIDRLEQPNMLYIKNREEGLPMGLNGMKRVSGKLRELARHQSSLGRGGN